MDRRGQERDRRETGENIEDRKVPGKREKGPEILYGQKEGYNRGGYRLYPTRGSRNEADGRQNFSERRNYWEPSSLVKRKSTRPAEAL